MRTPSSVTAGLLLAVSACAGNVARSSIQVSPVAQMAPAGTLVLINGAELASGHSLAELSRSSITSIDVVKGQAATLLYGARADSGVIVVATSDSVAAARITKH